MPRLLLDENLSEAVLNGLPEQFVGSTHVRQLIGSGATDQAVWCAARDGNYIIITLDSDFELLSLARDAPPKVIWISLFNPSTAVVRTILASKVDAITRFSDDRIARFMAVGPLRA